MTASPPARLRPASSAMRCFAGLLFAQALAVKSGRRDFAGVTDIGTAMVLIHWTSVWLLIIRFCQTGSVNELSLTMHLRTRVLHAGQRV